MPGGIGVRTDKGQVDTIGGQVTETSKKVRSLPLAVRAELKKLSVPLVIDDFHYIEGGVQLELVRNLKDLIFDGLPVILASVPHRAYDAVRVEREMTGRV